MNVIRDFKKKEIRRLKHTKIDDECVEIISEICKQSHGLIRSPEMVHMIFRKIGKKLSVRSIRSVRAKLGY
jgi:hypothetical protein